MIRVDEAHYETVLRNAERLHDRRAVEAALDGMAVAIERRFRGDTVLYLPVLQGGLIPAALLATRLELQLELDYIHATRYRGETRGSDLVWRARPLTPLKGRRVLVVDDILDEGHTLEAILEWCRAQGAREVSSAVLVDKRHDRRVPGLSADFTGLEVPDRYVFGCGLDYRERFRNLPEIYAVSEEHDGS